jgi:molecular chaperone HtpG
MSANLQRVLKQMGQAAPASKPILEVNPDHPLVKKMDEEQDESLFEELAAILFDQATLAEGGQLEDPAAFVHRLNKLMLSFTA